MYKYCQHLSEYSKRHNKYFALAKNRIRKEKTLLCGHNLTWETQRYPYLGNSCRKGNTKRKYTSRQDTFSLNAVTFEPML